MTLSDLQTLIGALTNDPNHDRYTTTDIGTELDAVQDLWNVEARIIEDTVSITMTANDGDYALSNLTGTPISFTRVIHKGKELKKKSKAWLDTYAGGQDWTQNIGTPRYYYIDSADPDAQEIVVYPLPQSGDVDGLLYVSYVKRHTSLSSSSDVPFNANTLLVPYHAGVAYHVAARLLLRDPSQQTNLKVYGPSGRWGIGGYSAIAQNDLSKVIEVFKALSEEEPQRMRGGRYWNSGNPRFNK